ncbi:hypothetical protein L6164_015704 [Bauhinia variegata]|uniref:Uncharacterized protein n=1 Tax=Bauhinia variegata TaxID=167791 RepID=A0ACB9NLH3_BAUVA|nr:hypothetical protein L6164_015704 [Bauhinia variegata]
MARLVGTAQRTLFRSCPFSSLRTVTDSRDSISSSLLQSRRLHAKPTSKSPFESNILRILGNEIEYRCDYAPPQQPVKKFNSFTLQDRLGEQWITLSGKFGDNEEIKIEATMFDGFEHVPKLGDDSSGVNVRLHISLLVDISKGEDGNKLEFVCSAWPDSLEVEKVYVLRRDRMLARPYMGPNFRNLNAKIQKEFREYLERRGVNSELSFFLHDYMMNKDRIELINWLRNVKTIVEK